MTKIRGKAAAAALARHAPARKISGLPFTELFSNRICSGSLTEIISFEISPWRGDPQIHAILIFKPVALHDNVLMAAAG